jgi:hypothetical protein
VTHRFHTLFDVFPLKMISSADVDGDEKIFLPPEFFGKKFTIKIDVVRRDTASLRKECGRNGG